MNSKNQILIFLLIFISSCSSVSREEMILKYSEDKEKANKYEGYLVDPARYTTTGAEYHTRYYKYLIGVARAIIEEKNINIAEKSIGFYYDKREDKKDKLYLGIDIITLPDQSLISSTYQTVARAQLWKYLRDILYVLQSCRSIFLEDEIVGSVIGIRWKNENISETVTIWIDKNDVIRYENNELTFDEIIHRNFVTNTEGKIIRLLQ